MLDFLRSILIRLHGEPVVLRNAIVGVVSLIAIFGVNVPDATLNTVIDFAALAISLLWATVSARARVTPV